MTMSAWDYLPSFEDDRIAELLLSGEHDDLNYLMDPPARAIPGSTILHMSCHTLSIPHIAYLAQRVFEEIGLDFVAMGGAENCCGAPQWAFEDDQRGKQVASLTLGAFRRAKPTRVVSTCPDCDILFQLHMTRQHTYSHTNILEVFAENIDRLASIMKNPVPRTVVIHYHDETPDRQADTAAMEEVLGKIPELKIVKAENAAGLGNHCLVQTGRLDNTIFEPVVQDMFHEASDLGADTLVVPYHGCYRQHCKRQLEHGIEVSHYLSLIADSIGIQYEERFKELRLLDDIDAAFDQIKDKGAKAGYSEDAIYQALKSKVYA